MKDRISKMAIEDIMEFIDDKMFDFDNDVQDIAAFDKNEHLDEVTWTLHNGRVITVAIKSMMKILINAYKHDM